MKGTIISILFPLSKWLQFVVNNHAMLFKVSHSSNLGIKCIQMHLKLTSIAKFGPCEWSNKKHDCIGSAPMFVWENLCIEVIAPNKA